MKIVVEARSDQWNADDFVGGPRIFTLKDVRPGKATQPYDIELVEGEGKVWRPPLTVLRILIAAWGDESDQWLGRRVELDRDPEVEFGAKKVGGIRIRAMSHIERPITLVLQKKRGVVQEHVIQPLEEPKSQPIVTIEQVEACTSIEELRDMWSWGPVDIKERVEARVKELQAQQDTLDPVEAGEPA